MKIHKSYTIAVLLFLYQGAIDLNSSFLMKLVAELQNNFVPFLNSFSLADRPGIFVVLYIAHRAFIHSLIVGFATGKKDMLQKYLFLDLFLVVVSFFMVAVNRLFDPYLDFTDPVAEGLFNLLYTPLLLLFFLPSYFLFRKESKNEAA